MHRALGRALGSALEAVLEETSDRVAAMEQSEPPMEPVRPQLMGILRSSRSSAVLVAEVIHVTLGVEAVAVGRCLSRVPAPY